MVYSDRLDDMVNAVEELLGATIAAATNTVTEKDKSNITNVVYGSAPAETATILIRYSNQGHPRSTITYHEKIFFLDIVATTIEVLESITDRLEQYQHTYAPANSGDPTHLDVVYVAGAYHPQHYALVRIVARWQW